MTHLQPKDPKSTQGSHRALFDQIQGAFGVAPNMFKTIGQSEAALEAMWGFFGALGKGKIDSKLGEKIAVYVADLNRCEYCLSAHTALGTKAGATRAEMSAAQGGESSDPRTQAALHFAGAIVKTKGQLTEDDFKLVRNAKFTDEEIAEILAHTALNIFTNYTNNAFGVNVDFPKVQFRLE